MANYFTIHGLASMLSTRKNKMPKYRVTVPLTAYVTLEVEADDKDDAIEKACDEASVREVVGDAISDTFYGALKGQELQINDDIDDEPEVEEIQ